LNALPSSGSASAFLALGALAIYGAAQALILVYACHHYVTLWRCHRAPARRVPEPPPRCPVVTVQLPIYNERRVAERLIDAVAALDYPAGLLEIQVLDDSTDETRAIAAAAVARHRARGIDIRHVTRGSRHGFKAGALAHGLSLARGEWIAVFDADFMPRADFLKRAVAHGADARVGLVQSRWGHLNRGRSALTAAQAVLLDAHFMLEHQARERHGLFFNFNGTAGLWRRACIEDAGGWSHDTLTEDLDLSYRAQLGGWRFVYDPAIESPAELPDDLEALKSQQRRWARGSIQTARKLLPSLWRAPLPLGLKLEATVHLTCNVCYPLLLVLALLLLPVMLVTAGAGHTRAGWALQAGIAACGFLPVMLFLAEGQRAGGGAGRSRVREVLAALALGVGLSINNARAVIAGLGGRVGDFERTPKTGDGGPRTSAPAYRATARRAGRTELVLAVYFALLVPVALAVRQPWALPFIALLATGFGMVGAGVWRGRKAGGG